METIEINGVTLKFSKLTLQDEREWVDWLRPQIMANAKQDAEMFDLTGKEKMEFLAAASANCSGDKCSLITPMGLEHAMTPRGIMHILKLASRTHHVSPGIDDETLNRLLMTRPEDVQRVLMHVLPNREKKAVAGQTAGPAGASAK